MTANQSPIGHLLRHLLLAVAVLLVGVGPVSAQEGADSEAVPWSTPLEEEVLNLIDEGQYLTARRRVEEVMAVDPDSMVGHYVLGRVYLDAEGSLPRAMIQLGRARQLYESRYAVGTTSMDSPWWFHAQLLFTIQRVALQMEAHEYQLEILDYYDALYDPPLTGDHAWPLMKLGRFDEARTYARAAIEMADPWQQGIGLNALCAIEGEQQRRQAYFDACLAAYEASLENLTTATDPQQREWFQGALVTDAYNAALAAHDVLRFDLAEQYALNVTQYRVDSTSNPWQLLVHLYTAQGRMEEAVNALREMNRWRTYQAPDLRDQNRAEMDVTLASVLLVAAQVEAGLRSVDRALERPDRRGVISSTPEQALGAHAVLRRALLRTAAELADEEASWSSAWSRMTHSIGGVGTDLQIWPDEERIVQTLTDAHRLLTTFRVYVEGGISPLPVWLLGDLVDVLGAGVVDAVLEEVREIESFEGIEPYLQGIEAEVELARGHEAQALPLARRALEGVPSAEALLRARLAAVGAEAARQGGEPAVELALLEMAMQLDPGVIRRQGLALPVGLTVASADPAAAIAAGMLGRSPRFRVGETGFRLSVEGSGSRLRICLYSPEGSALSCTAPAEERAAAPALSDEERAAHLVGGFHRETFAMPLGLSDTDLSSLDGSSTIAEQAVRERLQGVLESAIESGQQTP